MRERNAPPEVRREVQELSLLFEISQILDRSLDLREVVDPVLKAMADHMGMLRGTLTLLNRETGEISIEAAYGLSRQPEASAAATSSAKGVTGKVVQTGQPADRAAHLARSRSSSTAPARARARKDGTSPSSACPIKLGNEVIGALSADRLFAEDVVAARRTCGCCPSSPR